LAFTAEWEGRVDLILSQLHSPPMNVLPVEIAERKGLGHPDTICDALAEKLSGALSRFYVERFGTVLHHNVDKVLLCAGVARPAFAGGEILEPIEIYISGRATRDLGGVRVPIEELADATCRGWLREHIHGLDPDRHVRLHLLVRPGSPELVELFLRRRAEEPPLANDSAVGVGFAPFSDLERATLAVEQELNSASVKASYPALGEDVKVLGIRQPGHVHLTIACAVLGRHVQTLADYADAKEQVRRIAQNAARDATDLDVVAAVNTADGVTPGSIYLTVTGTSAESGDDGQAGRGNRSNGLITPYRPMSLESAAGKNPVSHPGRLYQIAAGRIAAAVVHRIEEVSATECYLASQIGHPVTDPRIAEVRVRMAEGGSPDRVAGPVREIVEAELRLIPTYWREASPGAHHSPSRVQQTFSRRE
jgi:S-adenosylmethionine synthetase